MYSTKTATVNNSEFNSSYIPVGINDDVKLQSIETLVSPQGKDYLKVTFEKNGQTASFTEWKNEKNMWIKTDEDLQKRDDLQFGRILQLINCFYDNTPEFEGNSFSEMIKWVKAKLEVIAKTNNTLRLKVVYDKNGYTTISRYGVYVEPMTVTKENSQIKLFKNDLLERQITADKEPVVDPLANSPISIPNSENKSIDFSDDNDELPF